MKVKIIHHIDETELEIGKRLLHTDDAFALLFDITQDIRSYFKHTPPSKEEAEKLLEKIRSDIYDTGLLDLYS